MLPDADVVRLAARRPDDPGRHLAQHHRQPGAAGDDRRAVPDVRLRPGRARPRRRRPRSSCASAIACCRGDRRAAPTMGEALDIEDYATEAAIGRGSPVDGETVADFLELTRRRCRRHRHPCASSAADPAAAARRDPQRGRRADPEGRARRARAGDRRRRARARRPASRRRRPHGAAQVGVIEAVIGRDSIARRRRPRGRMALHDRHGVNLIAVSRARRADQPAAARHRPAAPATWSCSRAAARHSARAAARARLPAARRADAAARQRAPRAGADRDPRRGDGR